MRSGIFSTLNLQIHLSQNRGGDAMFNFLVKTEESWYYNVIIVGPSKFFLEYWFSGHEVTLKYIEKIGLLFRLM